MASKRRSDANVQRLVKKEMLLKKASDDCAERARAEAQAMWITKQATSSNGEEDRRREKACLDELILENENIIRIRRAKLKKVYEADFISWQQQLNDKGLAIIANRN